MLDDEMILFSKSIGLMEGSYNNGLRLTGKPMSWILHRYVNDHQSGDTIIDSD